MNLKKRKITGEKYYRLNIVASLFLMLGVCMPAPIAAQEIVWPGGKKAAIVLTYDDGLESHLKNAIPQLNKYNLKGTFFLYGSVSEKRFPDWRKVSQQGHELGNHSLFHPCPGKGPASNSRFVSENYDVPSILREIDIMNKLLFAISDKTPKSYAYPCSQTKAGGTDYSDSLRLSGLVKFARTGGNRTIITDFNKLNYFKIYSHSVKAGSNADALIEYAQSVLNAKGLGIYIFHGTGGDYLSVSSDNHKALIVYLAKHNHEIWIATFGEVMEYIQRYYK